MIDKYEYNGKTLPPNFEGDYKADFLVTKNEELLAGYSFFCKNYPKDFG